MLTLLWLKIANYFNIFLVLMLFSNYKTYIYDIKKVFLLRIYFHLVTDIFN